MEEREKKITLVVVCDNHYALMLAALLKSIEINHVSGSLIVLYIIEDKVSDYNKKRISGSLTPGTFELHWLKISDVITGHTNLPLDSSSFPLNVYARLFIPYIIPSSLTKVLYLDVDMIMRRDISDLWDVELLNKVVAGVVDRSETVDNPWGGIINYKELGIPADTKYFNSGLLLIDPQQWRAQDTTNRILACINENKKYTSFPDQYGLNVIFANQWLELDRKWNCYAISEETDPYLIHFIGVKPIYKSYAYNPQYRDLFYRFLEQTQWKGHKPVGDYRRLIKKLYNKIVKKSLALLKLF